MTLLNMLYLMDCKRLAAGEKKPEMPYYAIWNLVICAVLVCDHALIFQGELI